MTDEEKTKMQQAMDSAAVSAAKELSPCKTVAEVADWWRRWYLKAGHKRLARLLMEIH